LNALRAFKMRPEFQIDSNRIYVAGSSMGGQSAHMAYNYPDDFAAADAGIAIVSWRSNSGCSAAKPSSLPVGSIEGTSANDYYDLEITSQRARTLPPIIDTWGTEDESKETCAQARAVLAMQRARQAYIAVWKVVGHQATEVHLDGVPYMFRYKKNEAYPAFSSVSTNEDVSAKAMGPRGSRNNADGQHNLYMDWQSVLHTFPGGAEITDTVTAFGLSLKSLTSNATASVTIRNAQQFRPMPGQSVQWRNESLAGQQLQSGTVVADEQGLLTVQLQIMPAGNRLTLSCTGCTVDNSFKPSAAISIAGAHGKPSVKARGKVPAAPPNVRIVRP
jgi:hypothetical protein